MYANSDLLLSNSSQPHFTMSNALTPALADTPIDAAATSVRSDYTVRTLRSAEEVEALRSAWTRWQTHPNSDLDHFLRVCQVRENVQRPHVIVVQNGDGPCAILAGRIEDGRIPPGFGYFTLFGFRVTRLAVIYQGLLGHVDETVASALVDALRATLDAGEADIVELQHLSEDSPLLRQALRGCGYLWRDGKPSWSTHWELALPRQPGGLLQGMKSKHRQWIRRKARELDEAFGARIGYRAFTPKDDEAALCAELETVARLTYQRGLGEGFKDDLEHRQRFVLFNQRSLLRAWTLRIDGAARAFCLGFVYGNTFYFSETGYDPRLRSHEVGTILFLHMADELIEEGIKKFNFGFGDAYYKQRFGDRNWREGTLKLYAHTPKAFTARVCIGFCNRATAVARMAAKRLGVLDKIKTGWRKRLSSGGKEMLEDGR